MSSDDSPIVPRPTMSSRSSTSEVTTTHNSRTPALTLILIHWASRMSSLLHTHVSRMASWSGRTECSLRWHYMMLDEYKTPRKFWPEAIDTGCHIINRVYLHKFLKKTSYELLTGKKPNVSYF